MAGHSVLQVPVPLLEPFVRGRHHHHDPDWVSSDPAFTHAHVTALAPWLPDPTAADLATVGALAATTPAHDVALGEVHVFPDGILHLRPSPDAGLRALTARLVAAFPSCPPYAGVHDDVVPHLSLDHADHLGRDELRRSLADVLPATVRVDRLDLAWWEAGRCHLVTSWPLAPTVGP